MSFVTVSSNRGKLFVEAVLSQDAASVAAQEAEIARRVRGEVNRLRAETETEARTRVEAELRAAMAPEAEALKTAAAALGEAWAQLASPLAQKEQELAGLVTELSFLLARHITGVEVATNPTSLQSLLARLIAEAVAERGPEQTLVLRLNPADHARLSTLIPPETASLLADDKITQGGALVEISAREGDPMAKIEWDATLEGRSESIRAALALPDPNADETP